MGRLTNFNFHGLSLVRDTFIETGTYHGETAANAARAGFRQCHTIEVHRPNYEIARANLATLPNVECYCGSSPDVLPQIIAPGNTTLYWLDAHFQGGSRDEQDDEYGQCPLLEELWVILEAGWDDGCEPFILIDDAHLFTRDKEAPLKRPFITEDWPTLDDIVRVLGDRFVIIESDDILHCLPRDLGWEIARKTQAEQVAE